MLSPATDDSESVASSAGSDDQPMLSPDAKIQVVDRRLGTIGSESPRQVRYGRGHNLLARSVTSGLSSSSLVSSSSAETSEASDTSSLDGFGNVSLSERATAERQGNQNWQDKQRLKCAHISNELVRLTDLLDALPPRRIVSVLEGLLRKRDSRSIVALSVLLPRVDFPPIKDEHCARCHHRFDPTSNDSRAIVCTVPHPTSAVVKLRDTSSGSDFRCRLCRKEFHLVDMHFYNDHVNAFLTGACFTGSHTTNPRHVTFGGAIRTCEDNGCIQFYV